MNIQIDLTPKGWQCPVCNRVNAPHVRHCDCHEHKVTITPTDVTPLPLPYSPSTTVPYPVDWNRITFTAPYDPKIKSWWIVDAF